MGALRRDKNAPALYELVKGRGSSRARSVHSPAVAPRPAPPPRPAPAIPDEDDSEGLPLRMLQWLRPGRIVKIPVGYLFFVLAGVIVVIFGAYALGYKKMESLAEAQRRADAQRDFVAPADPLVNLRLADPAPSAPVSNAPATIAGSPEAAPRRASPPVQTSNRTPPAGVVDVATQPDPRQVDMNYLIAATLPADEAQRAAQFLAGHGLAVALAPVNNRSSRREVVVLSGITREQYRQGDLRLQIEERVKSIGREFASEHRGGDDFASCWWKKFSG